MPVLINNTVAVSLDELVPEYYPSYEALKKAIQRDKQRDFGLRCINRGGRGRQLLIDYDTLPGRIRLNIRDPRIPEHPLVPFYQIDEMAIDFYATFQFADGSHIAESIQRRYVTNASVLQAATKLKEARRLEWLKFGESKFRPLIRTVCSDVTSFNNYLLQHFGTQHTLPSNLRRFSDVFNKFMRNGYVSLISRKHGNTNAAKVDDKTIALLNAMFADARKKPSPVELSRIYNGFLNGYIEVVNSETGELFNPEEFKPISKTTIYLCLNDWENRIATHKIRSGDRQKYMANYKPHHSLLHPEYAGSILSVDDRQPPFEYAPGRRIWFYMGIDLGSEAYVAWVYGKTKEGIIVEFYRQLVRNYHQWGIPLPYELECELSLNSSLKDSILTPGRLFQQVRMEPNNARGKRIEAYFGQIRYGLEKQHLDFVARPFARRESNQAGAPSKPLPYDKIIEQCLRDIETWNNMPHSRIPGKSRWEVLLEKQHPELKPINFKLFLRQLGYHTRSSCRAGIIRLQGEEYLLGNNGKVAAGEELINYMCQVEGKEVDIYWLDGNNGRVIAALVYSGERLICEAVPKPIYHRAKLEQTQADFAAREIMSKYVATIEGFGRRRAKEIIPVTIIGSLPVTINNKFAIKETAHRFDADMQPEILPEPGPEDEFVPVDIDFKRNMIDRF